MFWFMNALQTIHKLTFVTRLRTYKILSRFKRFGASGLAVVQSAMTVGHFETRIVT